MKACSDLGPTLLVVEQAVVGERQLLVTEVLGVQVLLVEVVGVQSLAQEQVQVLVAELGEVQVLLVGL